MTNYYKSIVVFSVAFLVLLSVGNTAPLNPVTKLEQGFTKEISSPHVKVGETYEVDGVKNQPEKHPSMKTVSLLIQHKKVKSYTPRGVFVQIGAYSTDNDRISKQINDLSSVGVVSLQRVEFQGNDILRLRVGPYGSIDDAIVVKNNLVKLGYKKARVVVEQ